MFNTYVCMYVMYVMYDMLQENLSRRYSVLTLLLLSTTYKVPTVGTYLSNQTR